MNTVIKKNDKILFGKKIIFKINQQLNNKQFSLLKFYLQPFSLFSNPLFSFHKRNTVHFVSKDTNLVKSALVFRITDGILISAATFSSSWREWVSRVSPPIQTLKSLMDIAVVPEREREESTLSQCLEASKEHSNILASLLEELEVFFVNRTHPSKSVLTWERDLASIVPLSNRHRVLWVPDDELSRIPSIPISVGLADLCNVLKMIYGFLSEFSETQTMRIDLTCDQYAQDEEAGENYWLSFTFSEFVSSPQIFFEKMRQHQYDIRYVGVCRLLRLIGGKLVMPKQSNLFESKMSDSTPTMKISVFFPLPSSTPGNLKQRSVRNLTLVESWFVGISSLKAPLLRAKLQEMDIELVLKQEPSLSRLFQKHGQQQQLKVGKLTKNVHQTQQSLILIEWFQNQKRDNNNNNNSNATRAFKLSKSDIIILVDKSFICFGHGELTSSVHFGHELLSTIDDVLEKCSSMHRQASIHSGNSGKENLSSIDSVTKKIVVICGMNTLQKLILTKFFQQYPSNANHPGTDVTCVDTMREAVEFSLVHRWRISLLLVDEKAHDSALVLKMKDIEIENQFSHIPVIVAWNNPPREQVVCDEVCSKPIAWAYVSSLVEKYVCNKNSNTNGNSTNNSNNSNNNNNRIKSLSSLSHSTIFKNISLFPFRFDRLTNDSLEGMKLNETYSDTKQIIQNKFELLTKVFFFFFKTEILSKMLIQLKYFPMTSTVFDSPINSCSYQRISFELIQKKLLELLTKEATPLMENEPQFLLFHHIRALFCSD